MPRGAVIGRQAPFRFKYRLAAWLFCALATAARAEPRLPALSTVGERAAAVFRGTGAASLVVVAVRGRDVFFQSFGETAPGSGQKPAANSLIRLCSVTKVFTTDVLVQLVAEKQITLDDPLQRFAPAGVRVPSRTVHGKKRWVTLLDLATHTAGLPREIGPAPRGSPHFTYPAFAKRWAWLSRAKLLTPPGTAALYSNLGFDFLADALQSAVHTPYARLLAQRILNPLGMRDTTLEPTLEQCSRLLRGENEEGRCSSTVATAGSSGLYSTPADMARWLRYLVGDTSLGVRQNAGAQAVYLLPEQLVSVRGLDHAGTPSGIGLGWLRLGASGSKSLILEKTGSGAGFKAYVALSPGAHTAVFVAFTNGHGDWQVDPFAAANEMLLALSNLPSR